MYKVIVQELPPEGATPKNIKEIINNAVPEGFKLVSTAVSEGPNGLQQLIIVFTGSKDS